MTPGALKLTTSPLKTVLRGVTISSVKTFSICGSGGCLGGAFNDFLDRPGHVEVVLPDVVVRPLDDPLEAADRILELDVLSRNAGKLFRHEEGLREEFLDFAGARDAQLVGVGELIHAENVDDVLEILVRLQDFLHPLRNIVMLVADDARLEDARSRIKRIDRGIDAEFRNLAAQNGRGVEMA